MGVGMLLIDCDSPTYNNHNVAVQSLSAGGPADNCKQVRMGPYPKSHTSRYLAASPNDYACCAWWLVVDYWLFVMGDG